jgi:isoquinoline 1-oxidoreductase beta subunit
MLIEAAAKKWSAPASECYASEGHVIHKTSGKKFHYGELVQEASKLEPPKSVRLKLPEEYKILRKALPRQDTPGKTNGKAIFGLDKKLPGMLYAVVERNPRFWGKVKSFDDKGAKAVRVSCTSCGEDESIFTRPRRSSCRCNSIGLPCRKKGLKWSDDTGFEHHSSD